MLVLFFLAAAASILCAHPSTFTVVSPQTYEQVLDILFSSPRPDRALEIYTLTLRLKPSFKPESEIRLTRYKDRVEGNVFIADGNVYAKLNNFKKKGGKDDARQMAKLARVRKTVLRVTPDDADNWTHQILNSVPDALTSMKQAAESEINTGTAEITLDGTIYDIHYQSGVDSINLELYDAEMSNTEITGSLEIIKLINTLRLKSAEKNQDK